jgi:hypothetical protein
VHRDLPRGLAAFSLFFLWPQVSSYNAPEFIATAAENRWQTQRKRARNPT